MNALWSILHLILAGQRKAILRAAALAFLVLAAGAALLGLSGWFVGAAATAGLAGAGTAFDAFRPAAVLRTLALGRAAARYGERLLAHDATLRALGTLRPRLLARYLAAPYQRMVRIRDDEAANRLIADIEALDGVAGRLVLPVVAGLAALVAALLALWFLVGPGLALWTVLGWGLGAAVIFGLAVRGAAPVARRTEAAVEAVQSRLVDLIRARRELAVYGRLFDQWEAVETAESRRLALRGWLDRVDRRTGAALSALGALVGGGVLAIGIAAAQAGRLAPAMVVLAFLAALALGEAVLPLRRAAAELGRMAEAARRVRHDLAQPEATLGRAVATGRRGIAIHDLSLSRPGGGAPLVSGLSLTVEAGETVVLTGPSGSGKSTLMLAIAGLHPVGEGSILIGGLAVGDWNEDDLRASVTLVPQASVLMAGTVAEALRAGAPEADDATLWEALEAVRLDRAVGRRGGTGLRLVHRGSGLAPGEARRLALARAILRRPAVLLLDEPTAGLDEPTARAVLKGIRAFLPETAILIASHGHVEGAAADRVVALR